MSIIHLCTMSVGNEWQHSHSDCYLHRTSWGNVKRFIFSPLFSHWNMFLLLSQNDSLSINSYNQIVGENESQHKQTHFWHTLTHTHIETHTFWPWWSPNTYLCFRFLLSCCVCTQVSEFLNFHQTFSSPNLSKAPLGSKPGRKGEDKGVQSRYYQQMPLAE